MKQKFRTNNSNQYICSKNNDKHVRAGLVLDHNRGITLVALIITIIVLLILAVVAITSISNSNIIKYARSVQRDYSISDEKEKVILAVQEAMLKGQGTINKNGITEGMNTYFTSDGWEDKTPESETDTMTIKIKVSERQYKIILSTGTVELVTGEDDPTTESAKVKDNIGKVFSENKDLTDEFENKITLPAGFKILVDDTTDYTETTIDVTKGIVIEDAKLGNQFVWIPVGKIFTNVDKTENVVITLGRYSNFTKNSAGVYTPVQTATEYAERKDINLNNNINLKYTCFEDASNNNNNTHHNAKNLAKFCLGTSQNGGYYLGRYEASQRDDGKLTSKFTDTTYKNLSQPEASEKCQGMYLTDKFESDLTNSYAYDTALIFIQEFGQADYATDKKIFAKDSYDDKQLNIYNMSGGYFEWSTETASDETRMCVKRGSISSTYGNEVDASSRRCDYKDLSGYTFRTILYFK